MFGWVIWWTARPVRIQKFKSYRTHYHLGKIQAEIVAKPSGYKLTELLESAAFTSVGAGSFYALKYIYDAEVIL